MTPLQVIRAAVRAQVSPARWRHIRGTALLARQLARRHGVCPRRAVRAAYLHDAQRDRDNAALRALPYTGWLQEVVAAYAAIDGAVMHAPAAARWAQQQGLCTDPEILHAVAWHPTGTAVWTPLLQVLFVADYAEPGRRHDDAAAVRALLPALTLAQAAARVAAAKQAWLRPGAQAVA